MPQVARPISTTTAGAWTDQIGGTTNMYAQLADDDDATYLASDAATDADVLVVKFGALVDPGVDTGFVLNYRFDKSVDGGDQIDLLEELRQGYTNEGSMGTLIQAQTQADISGAQITAGQMQIDAANAALITNFSNLYARSVKTISVVTGGLTFAEAVNLSDATDRTIYTTSSVPLLPNRLIVAFINITQDGTGDPHDLVDADVTGWGLTWHVKGTPQHWGATTDATRRKVAVAVAKTSTSGASSGSLQVDLGTQHTSCEVEVVSVGGADLSLTALNCLKQCVYLGPTVGASNATLTLAAPDNANNRTLGFVACNNNAPTTVSIGGSFTNVGPELAHNNPSISAQAAARLDAFTSSMSFSFGGQVNKYGAVGLEIVAA